MPTFRLALVKGRQTPLRIPVWNAAVGAGDDLKLALTVYDADTGQPANVDGARVAARLLPDGLGWTHDYGADWRWSETDGTVVQGRVQDAEAGRINLRLTMRGQEVGRMRLVLAVDYPDGLATQIEGVVQLRRGAGVPRTQPTFFQLGVTQFGSAALAPDVEQDGFPADVDGFAMTDAYAGLPLDPALSDMTLIGPSPEAPPVVTDILL